VSIGQSTVEATHCPLPVACCLLPVVNCLLSIAYCLLPIVYCLFPEPYSPKPEPCSLNPEPYALSSYSTMRSPFIISLITLFSVLGGTQVASAQLEVIEINDAQSLAQRLAGEGVTILNPVLTSVRSGVIPTGYFYNRGGTQIGIDSGIVLTNGRARTPRGNGFFGLNGDGVSIAASLTADENLALQGDADLAAELGIPVDDVFDAVILEFDFIPLGDTIRFNYIMSSEEYFPDYVCFFNDAFGFFISGPGITGKKNIALIPGTNTPVSITNVNDVTVAGCVNNPQYYVDNTSNVNFTHDGHTAVFRAVSAVQPCQTYHLKLVIADVNDQFLDSGVFLEAKSLNSNAAGLVAQTPIDNQGTPYLAEGCTPGTITVRRPLKEASSKTVNLLYGGTATNGVDFDLLPSSVTIPANDSFVTLDVRLIADALNEGTEILKVYALASCTATTVADSTIIYLRDFDTLAITPKTATICRRDSVQLTATPGYSSYSWNADARLSDATLHNPFAKPVHSPALFICTAMDGTCARRDSSIVTIQPPLRLFAGNDTLVTAGQPVQLDVTPPDEPPGTLYSWSPPTFLDDPSIATPVATLTANQWYVVTATTPGGCEEKDGILIKVYKGPDIYVPTAFTPNNDGLNDRLFPVTVGIASFKSFQVFNRWGQMVYSSTALQPGWDGKLQGVEQGSASFTWFAEGVDFKGNSIRRRGFVTLIR
jgi:gliding motility-associated-like protein